jgi:cytoskeletal protein RodZ
MAHAALKGETPRIRRDPRGKLAGMSDAVPDSLIAPPIAPRDRRIVATALLSVGLHLLLLGLVLLPRLHLPEPDEPPAIAVELVPPPSSSAEMPASSAPPPVSSEAASAVSSEAPSSQPAPSSVEAASAGESASGPPSSAAPPLPAARPIVIPVGPSAPVSAAASSAEAASASEAVSSAASETGASTDASALDEASALTTSDPAASHSVADAGETAVPPPSLKGALHAARRFYLDAVLDAPAMARAREAIRKLPPEKRLVQTCNIEAVGQLGNAGRGFSPDAVVANAFVPPVASGSSFTVSGGAFRSGGKWYALAYACTLSQDMDAVTAFSYRIGADVTATLRPKMGG